MKIKEYGFVDISRKDGASFTLTSNLTEDEETLLISCLPFGEVKRSSKIFKQKSILGNTFISLIRVEEDGSGKGILVKLPKPHGVISNPVMLLSQLDESLESLALNQITELEIRSDLEQQKVPPFRVTNSEVLISSILAGIPTYVLGTHEQVTGIMSYLYTLFPPELHTFLDITSQTSSFSDNTFIMGIPISLPNLERLDQLSSEKNTVVFVDNNTCYGNYSTPLTKKIAKLAGRGKYVEGRQEIQNLYQLAIQDGDVAVNIAEFAKANKMSASDATLVIKLRSRLFNKKTNLSHFERLIA